MVTSSFLPGRGGIETHLAELCEELSPRLMVFAPRSRGAEPIPPDLPYETEGYPANMLLPYPSIARAATEAARRTGTDKILFGTPWPLILLGPRLKQYGFSYAAIVHGAELLVPAAVPVLGKRLATALAGADIVLTVSSFTGSKCREVVAKHNLEMPPTELLRARVDVDRFHPRVGGTEIRERLRIGQHDKVVLSFGRLVKRKGVKRLIKAMPKLNQRAPGAVLVVAGTGPQARRLRRMARRSGERIVFAGAVSDEDAPRFYSMADVFALPVADRWFGLEVEGLGVVLLEASACGTPAVTGRSGGTPEAVVHGVTGFVVDARNQDELVESLARIMNDRNHAAKMGGAGRDHVRSEFSERPLPRLLLDWLG